ncbi:anti-repressor SinI family protein [Halobacillus campisalis]|uniref:Anti-repressor SinI family protein n=1 Tax=Halobacillus campisalis TaxID=435909 RepID=A0ABW2K6V7_9BACI|nr:anti-repressor SinI family protein [Halobacillus campisalis]
METFPDVKTLDVEWVELIEEARNLGLSVEEIREFLQSEKI